MTTFAETVRDWLTRRGLSAHAAESRLGVADSTINNWLAGTSVPPATKVAQLAKAMGRSAARLRRCIDQDRARLHALKVAAKAKP